MSLVWITLFGILGVWSRALADHLLIKNIQDFPLPTLIVNIIGCFLIGLITSHPKLSDPIKSGMIIGFCGGLTTFSSFIFQIDQLSIKNITVCMTYLILSIILGLAALKLAQRI